MMQTLLVRGLAALAIALVAACGDGDDGDGDGDGGGGGSACARAEQLCADDPDVEIDCTQGEPSMAAADCIGSATTCDAVGTCLLIDFASAAGDGG